jgi:hypothetical protein
VDQELDVRSLFAPCIFRIEDPVDPQPIATGFFFTSCGWALTAWHAVLHPQTKQPHSKMPVYLYNPLTQRYDRRSQAAIYPEFSNPKLDIALLKVEGEVFDPLKLSCDWKYEDELIIMGFQEDPPVVIRALVPKYHPTAEGLIENKEEPALRMVYDPYSPWHISYGTSGGPVLNVRTRSVIAVVKAQQPSDIEIELDKVQDIDYIRKIRAKGIEIVPIRDQSGRRIGGVCLRDFRGASYGLATPIDLVLNDISKIPPELIYEPAVIDLGSRGASEIGKYVFPIGRSPFYIDPYPVTCEEFQRFINQTGGSWESPFGQGESVARMPATNLAVQQAREYARLHGKRLPTPEEWLMAAQEWFDAQGGAISGEVRREPRPIPDYKEIEIPVRHIQHVGEVREWAVDENGQAYLCGVSFRDPPRLRREWAQILSRSLSQALRNVPQSPEPNYTHDAIGFRCVRDEHDR